MDQALINRLEKAKRIEKYRTVYEEAGLADSLQEIREADTMRLEAVDYQQAVQDDLGENGMTFQPGQAIVLCGYIGQAGTILLSRYHKEKLGQKLPNRFIASGKDYEQSVHAYPDWEKVKASGVTAVAPVEEGGMFRTIFQLGKDSGLGFEIDYKKVLIRQVTIEFCELFDLNPWELLSCGCLLLITDQEQQTLACLQEQGFEAAAIGYMTEKKDKLVRHPEEVSSLNRPKQDGMLQVWKVNQ